MAGGGSSKSQDGKKSARIEIIPLIDVIFFLLATFVLFTLSLNKTQGLPVLLPPSVSGQAEDRTGTATISVTQEGTLAWNTDPITLDEFLVRLQRFKLDNPGPDTKILINGDENAMFSQVIYVFDETRKAGIQRVLIETRVKSAVN